MHVACTAHDIAFRVEPFNQTPAIVSCSTNRPIFKRLKCIENAKGTALLCVPAKRMSAEKVHEKNVVVETVAVTAVAPRLVRERAFVHIIILRTMYYCTGSRTSGTRTRGIQYIIISFPTIGLATSTTRWNACDNRLDFIARGLSDGDIAQQSPNASSTIIPLPLPPYCT